MNNKRVPKGKSRFLFCCVLAAFLAGCATANSLFKDTDSAAPEGRGLRQSAMYRFIENIAWVTRQKAVWEKDAENLAAYFRGLDQSGRRVPPARAKREFNVLETVSGGCPCYIISPRENLRADKALMYLHGGGFFFEPDDFEWDFVLSAARELSAPVCMPLYPVFPETDPERLLSFVARSYRLLMTEFPGAEISVAGISAGADLALGLCHYISAGKTALPMPAKLICISPAMTIEPDPATLAAMRGIDRRDPVLSINMLQSLPALLDFLRPPMTRYNAPFYGDFSAFPPIYLFSGTSDIFYPQMRPFVERVRSQNKHIEFYTGQSMMHCWAILPFAPETRQARERIFEIIAGKSGADGAIATARRRPAGNE